MRRSQAAVGAFAFAFSRYAAGESPPVLTEDIARFADPEHTVFVLVVQNKHVPLTGLYLFRSFAKKPSASFKILFASRNSEFSLKLAVAGASLFIAQRHRSLWLVPAADRQSFFSFFNPDNTRKNPHIRKIYGFVLMARPAGFEPVTLRIGI